MNALFLHTTRGPAYYYSSFAHFSSHQSQCGARKIGRVLVANRGEIAIRVMRTAKRMGIETIGVYSDADENSRHTKCADSAYRIGEPSPLKSYLRGDKIIEVARAAGVDAIHPGYGFLSENADFAELCATNGIIFMGPPASAIRDMGMKNKAKQIMLEANVPVIHGYNGPNQEAQNLLEEAKKIGFPVMMKAVCGGGGKGMRIAHTERDFIESLESARSEAQKAFGNTDMIVEKYLQRPRHVEVQIFGDMHGNYVYLWERDCSIQRRHQKIIEEAPAPGFDFEKHHWLGKTAVDAARAVNYVGAGTVEFILDTTTNHFYFMEMNTRLQVEHPVTEAITGLDLVEWQFRVAQGEQLPLTQENIQLKGHAIEARIYAEDSAAGFIPTAGTLEHLQFPDERDGTIRVDSGIGEGDQVTVHYDPMIAKIIAAGHERAQAIRLLDAALQQTHIGGLCNNVNFVRACLQHGKFANGDLYTDFIAEHQQELLTKESGREPSEEALLEGAIGNLLIKSFECIGPSSSSPFLCQPAYFRLNHHAKQTVTLGDRAVEVEIMADGKCYKVDQQRVIVRNVEQTRTEQTNRPMVRFGLEMASNGRSWNCKAVALSDGIAIYGVEHRKWDTPTESDEIGASGDLLASVGDGNARSPMPGIIEKLMVRVGDKVARGQPMVALNAMKMEFLIRAPFDGFVASLNCSLGQSIAKDAILVRLNKEETGDDVNNAQ